MRQRPRRPEPDTRNIAQCALSRDSSVLERDRIGHYNTHCSNAPSPARIDIEPACVKSTAADAAFPEEVADGELVDDIVIDGMALADDDAEALKLF